MHGFDSHTTPQHLKSTEVKQTKHMAIYEYRCEKCDVIIEEVSFKLNDKKSIECPICKGKATKIVSSGSFIIHGFNQNNNYAGHNR